MHCLHCGEQMAGRQRKYCDRRCGDAAYYQRKTACRSALPQAPVLHHGAFQAYQERYAGLVDVIITDLPYARKALPLYEALGQFALTTLVPGGWLLCLTGWGIDLEIRQQWLARGLEFVTVGCYDMPSVHNRSEKYLSTGKQTWQEYHKPVLWFQKPGTRFHRRRGGTRDRVVGTVGDTSYDQTARPWEQSLHSFQQLVRSHTNPPDVICDPCMGWGTTLEACVSQERPRVIGIELLPERYAYARQRLGLAPWS